MIDQKNVKTKGFSAGDIIATKILEVNEIDHTYIIGWHPIISPELILDKTGEITIGIDIEAANEYFKKLPEDDSKSYEDGLKDAWEMMLKVSEMTMDERLECFGYSEAHQTLPIQIIHDFTAKELAERLDAWQSTPTLKVGDVIMKAHSHEVGVIAEFDKTYKVIWKEMGTTCVYGPEDMMRHLKNGQYIKTDKNVADELQGLWEKAEGQNGR